MKFRHLCLSAIFCLFFASTILAQQPDTQRPTDPCLDNAQTTAEMRNCVGQDYEKADKELNRVYAQLMTSLRDDKAQQAMLKTAQTAWLKYRDTNCDFESFENRGGTIYPVVRGSCLATMTRARTTELRTFLEEGRER